MGIIFIHPAHMLRLRRKWESFSFILPTCCAYGANGNHFHSSCPHVAPTAQMGIIFIHPAHMLRLRRKWESFSFFLPTCCAYGANGNHFHSPYPDLEFIIMNLLRKLFFTAEGTKYAQRQKRMAISVFNIIIHIDNEHFANLASFLAFLAVDIV
jgi:hypothetical protein